MAKRKVRPSMVFLFAALTAAASFGGGHLYVRSQAEKYAEEDAAMPETAMNAYVERLSANQFDGIYAATQRISAGYDTENVYNEKLASLFTQSEPLHAVKMGETDNAVSYRIYSDTAAIADASLMKNGNEWELAVPLKGQESYTLEVPAGSLVSVNDIPFTKDMLVEADVPAAVCSQMPAQTVVPHMDIYRIDGLLGEPEITISGIAKTANVKNVLSGNLIVGEEVTDQKILDMIIKCGETIAKFPAQEATLGDVAAIAFTQSYWYQRYQTVQNYWFTSHAISNFSNEKVLKCIKLDDDTMLAHVVFDYFADNGEVHRTWHIGYQMTLMKSGDTWKVANMGIDNELNPNTVDPESDPE
ncbi:MAG: hypothetical protein K6F23_04420 [Solobacterium sp.]|nr:hypothetical protein [Solobacterium sp.]